MLKALYLVLKKNGKFKLPFICVIQILGVEGLLGTDNGWPYLLGIALFPSILQMSLLPFCPESPRYLLITRQREQDAREGKFIDADQNN